MNNRKVVIELIQEFILQKPKRPYAEVEEYAQKLHASYEELKEAITNLPPLLDENGIDRRKSLKDKFACLKPIFSPNPVKVGAAFAVVTVGFSFGIINMKPKTKPLPVDNNSVLSVQVKKNQEEKKQDREIYANEKIIDAKKVFSYPASNITLKFDGKPKKEVMGFFPYWMTDKLNEITFEEFTSVNLFALEADGNGNIVIENEKGAENPGWTMWRGKELDDLIKQLKSKKIKINIVIKCFDKRAIEDISTSDEAQKKLISNIIQLINSKSLDGANIDFEYTGKARDVVKSGFTRFVANLGNELKRQLPEGKLTVDTYLSSAASGEFFDIESLNNHIDSFVIMAYDVNTPKGNPGPIAPMEGESGVMGYLQSYLERVPPSKIILALPHYGYDWPVDSLNKSLDRANILSYAEIAEVSKKYDIGWDQTWQTPYYRYVDGSGVLHEVHYENIKSLGIKYEFIKNKNFKGLGIWAIGYDGKNQEIEQLILDKFTK